MANMWKAKKKKKKKKKTLRKRQNKEFQNLIFSYQCIWCLLGKGIVWVEEKSTKSCLKIWYCNTSMHDAQKGEFKVTLRCDCLVRGTLTSNSQTQATKYGCECCNLLHNRAAKYRTKLNAYLTLVRHSATLLRWIVFDILHSANTNILPVAKFLWIYWVVNR